jgi:hypothetical protein
VATQIQHPASCPYRSHLAQKEFVDKPSAQGSAKSVIVLENRFAVHSSAGVVKVLG